MPKQGFESNAQEIFKSIFTRARNLEKLSISGILFDGGVNDYQILADSIRDKKLKSLSLHSPISDTNAFRMICESFSGSEIEALTLKEAYPHISQNTDLDNLIEVIPRMKFLRNLDLNGQVLRNKHLLFGALEGSNVEYLSLTLRDLNDNDAVKLAKLILSSNLMELYVGDNVMSQKGYRALEAAKEMKPRFQLQAWRRW